MASPQYYPKRKQIAKTIRSQVSPFAKSHKKLKRGSLLSSSETSIETLEKVSMFDNSSDTKTVGQTRPESIDYEAELDNCRRQNLNLQSKIENLQRKAVNSIGKGTIFRDVVKDNLRNCDERPVLSKNKEEVQREFELMHDQIMKKVRSEHEKQLKKLESSLTHKFYNDLQDAQTDYEVRTSKKVAEITAEYERKFSRAQEEVIWLKKQNEKLKRNLDEAQAKHELVKHTQGDIISNSSIDLKKQYKELNKQFIQLQHDYVQLKRDGSSLCQKCKAVTDTNNELFSKIHRIRAFLDSNS